VVLVQQAKMPELTAPE